MSLPGSPNSIVFSFCSSEHSGRLHRRSLLSFQFSIRTPTPPTPTPPCSAELCVFKFNDQNGNGVRDFGEPGLAGWTIHVTDPNMNVVASMTTGAQGSFCIGVPAPVTYTVSEVTQNGWTQTLPPAPESPTSSRSSAGSSSTSNSATHRTRLGHRPARSPGPPPRRRRQRGRRPAPAAFPRSTRARVAVDKGVGVHWASGTVGHSHAPRCNAVQAAARVTESDRRHLQLRGVSSNTSRARCVETHSTTSRR